MLKQDEIMAFLDTPESANLSNREIATKLDSSESNVRRAKQLHLANQLMKRMEIGEKETDESEIRATLLVDMLRADQAEEVLELILEDLKEEVKAAKAKLTEAIEHRRSLGREGREFHPLFDHPFVEARKQLGEDGAQDAADTFIKEVFAALLSVGHTEAQSRIMIDLAIKSGQKFDSVSKMVDFIYQAKDTIQKPKLAATGS